MNSDVAGRLHDPCFDPAALHARRTGDVWRLWLRLGRELLLRPAGVLAGWRLRSLERRLLGGMGERELQDLGLTPQAAQWEINKPFWKA